MSAKTELGSWKKTENHLKITITCSIFVENFLVNINISELNILRNYSPTNDSHFKVKSLVKTTGS